MALVLALGALGVGFAAWTDTVTVNGTVTTGDVDITVEDYSGTYVWKTDEPGEIFVERGWMDDIGIAPPDAIDAFPNPHPLGTAGIDPVAYATAGIGQAGDDTIFVDFVNMFPCIDFTADFLLHYAGSIPVKVSMSNIEVLGPPELVENADIRIEYFEADEFGNYNPGQPLDIAFMQLHYCDYIVVAITIHLDQVPDNMNQNGTITGTITVKQWNEVPVQ